jgi:methylated-DNA-protein-cysteine methyltransferase-like protein
VPAETAERPEPAEHPEHRDTPGDDFESAVAAVLTSLRPGDVVTYGEVAAEAGFPGAARAVGRVLARSDDEYPWWRVVTATGRLVPGHEVEHERRLRSEGVAIVGGRVRPRR